MISIFLALIHANISASVFLLPLIFIHRFHSDLYTLDKNFSFSTLYGVYLTIFTFVTPFVSLFLPESWKVFKLIAINIPFHFKSIFTPLSPVGISPLTVSAIVYVSVLTALSLFFIFYNRLSREKIYHVDGAVLAAVNWYNPVFWLLLKKEKKQTSSEPNPKSDQWSPLWKKSIVLPLIISALFSLFFIDFTFTFPDPSHVVSVLGTSEHIMRNIDFDDRHDKSIQFHSSGVYFFSSDSELDVIDDISWVYPPGTTAEEASADLSPVVNRMTELFGQPENPFDVFRGPFIPKTNRLIWTWINNAGEEIKFEMYMEEYEKYDPDFDHDEAIVVSLEYMH